MCTAQFGKQVKEIYSNFISANLYRKGRQQNTYLTLPSFKSDATNIFYKIFIMLFDIQAIC